MRRASREAVFVNLAPVRFIPIRQLGDLHMGRDIAHCLPCAQDVSGDLGRMERVALQAQVGCDESMAHPRMDRSGDDCRWRPLGLFLFFWAREGPF